MRPGTRHSRFYLRLAFTRSLQETRRPRIPYGGYKIITFILRSVRVGRVGGFESRRAEAGWKRGAFRERSEKGASGAERAENVEFNQSKAQNLKLGRLANSFFGSYLVG